MGWRRLKTRMMNVFSDKRIPSAAERNKEPICSVLKKLLPADREIRALEIASGSGLHAAYFAQNFPNITWVPSECDKSQWPSLLAYKADCKNMEAPLEIDVSTELSSWNPVPELGSYQLILNINMIHISPWAASQGLFGCAGLLLSRDGILVTYGPYAKNGHLAPLSNVKFNRSLQNENSNWGIRDIADLSEEGKEHGLILEEEYDMPANNKMLVFRRNSCLG